MGANTAQTPTQVAVYGSLRKGYGNHRLLGESPLVRTGWLPGFKLIDLGSFPGAVRCKQGSKIFVEVYEVDAETLKALDHLEGYDETDVETSLYLRKSYQCANDVQVSVYVYNGAIDHLPEIQSGDWSNRN